MDNTHSNMIGDMLARLFLSVIMAVGIVGFGWITDVQADNTWKKEVIKDHWGGEMEARYVQTGRVEEAGGIAQGVRELTVIYLGNGEIEIVIGDRNNAKNPISGLEQDIYGNNTFQVQMRGGNVDLLCFGFGEPGVRRKLKLLKVTGCGIVRALRDNANYKIVVSFNPNVAGADWFVRANIKGGLPMTEQEKRDAKVAEEAEQQKRDASGSVTDSRDGKTYKTIKMPDGNIWMVENLNYRTEKRSCCYNNDNSNCEKYGRLYDWNTAKTACPTSWHLPSEKEWTALIESVGVGFPAAQKLRSASGFAALRGGSRSSDGSFTDADDKGRWWTATATVGDVRGFNPPGPPRPTPPNGEAVKEYANGIYMDYSSVGVDKYDKNRGLSVRCVADN